MSRTYFATPGEDCHVFETIFVQHVMLQQSELSNAAAVVFVMKTTMPLCNIQLVLCPCILLRQSGYSQYLEAFDQIEFYSRWSGHHVNDH